eukprot:m.63358 g.63358  ORF g.63358 m.63358 type:complete len:65 (+) comp8065_c0_seq4:3137-3331(+)
MKKYCLFVCLFVSTNHDVLESFAKITYSQFINIINMNIVHLVKMNKYKVFMHPPPSPFKASNQC